MAKKSMFPLKMADGFQVRELEELQEHFDIISILGYYADSRLVEWLEARFYEDEAEKIVELKSLDLPENELKKKLCEILGVTYNENKVGKIDLSDIFERNERLKKLRKFTSDDKILTEVDKVAFAQEELKNLLKEGAKTVYLCEERFTIPRKKGITYVGVGMPKPKVKLPNAYISLGIVLDNVDMDIDDIISQAKKCPNETDKVKLWQIAAEMGNTEAQLELVNIDERSKCVVQDKSKMVEREHKAAKQGNDGAQNNLGNCYNFENGVKRDYKEDVEWYRKAGEQGNDGAQNNLGNYYYFGNGVKRDYKEAVEWYRKAAEQGNDGAQNNLGNCYYFGNGVKRDYKEAVEWYNKAVKQGNGVAQNNLGNCYYFGNGVEQDYIKAVEWYRKAAKQGYDGAQNNLGNCYCHGNGVEQDYKEAVEWYRKAVE